MAAQDERTSARGRLSIPKISGACPKASPRAGRLRIHGVLGQQREEPPPSERTVGRAMARNRQGPGAPGPWQSAREAQAEVPRFTPLPYRPAYRPPLGCTERRSLLQLAGSWG